MALLSAYAVCLASGHAARRSEAAELEGPLEDFGEVEERIRRLRRTKTARTDGLD